MTDAEAPATASDPASVDTAAPEIAAMAAVYAILAKLPSDEARQLVLDFVYSKFKLKAVDGRRGDAGGGEDEARDDEDPEDAAEAFFSKFEHTKPADNVHLIAAYHYSRYGTEPFTVEEIKTQADAVGLDVPAKPYMTLVQGGRKNKSFYQKEPGKGTFRVTVHGAAFFKEKFEVKKGRLRKPVVNQES